MHIGDLSPNQPAHQYVGGLGDRLEHGKYLVAFRMSPPAAVDRLSCEDIGQPWRRPLCRSQDDTVLLDERNRLLGAHAVFLRRGVRDLSLRSRLDFPGWPPILSF